MKELILGGNSSGSIGTKQALQTFNKTYITRKLNIKHEGMVATVGRKSSKSIKKKPSSPSVNWDPMTIERDLEFKDV